MKFFENVGGLVKEVVADVINDFADDFADINCPRSGSYKVPQSVETISYQGSGIIYPLVGTTYDALVAQKEERWCCKYANINPSKPQSVSTWMRSDASDAAFICRETKSRATM